MVYNDCRNFRSNRIDSFQENRKKSKNGCFWANFGYISHHTILMPVVTQGPLWV